jgi:hypothetical protein
MPLSGCGPASGYDPHNGDIVFQTSKSPQSQAIQLATKSPYSHMGLVYLRDSKPYVLEAVQPVKLTPLDAWVSRGKDGHFVARRLREADAVLTPDTLRRMRAVGESFIGKDYDLYFGWSDQRIYCSELVWKIFDRGAGIQLGQLQRRGDFDFASLVVQAKVAERYGERVPVQERVITPVAMFNAPQLETVFEN